MHQFRVQLLFVLMIITMFVSETNAQTRIPAEWETHAGTWMQWPKGYETSYRPNFCSIIDVLQEYEPVNIIVLNSYARTQAQNFLLGRGVPLTNITWHIMPYNAAWLRDNGPVWAMVDGAMVVQDWGFDAWGGQYPPWDDDDAIPCQIAAQVGVSCQSYDLICERGNLDFNGAGALIASWPCQSNRNPGMSMAEMESLYADAFGITNMVWLMSAPPTDLTGGHTDGIARFIDENTVAVARYVDQSDPEAFIYEEAAEIIEAAGFQVERIDIPGHVQYDGQSLAAIYVNWLVVNGAVITTGFGVQQWDDAAQARIEEFFPGRDVHVVETLELWRWGGGVHCVTNDQPLENSFSGIEDFASASTRILLGWNNPNPFNPRTEISFSIGSTQSVILGVYNVQGRLVRELIPGTLDAGQHSVFWDGADDAGRGLPSGTYFCRIEGEPQAGSIKMSLVR